MDRIEYTRNHHLGRFKPDTVWTDEYVKVGSVSNMLVYVEGVNGDEFINVEVVCHGNPRVGLLRIMEIQLSKRKNSYIVDLARIDRKFQGFGIAPKIYRYLLKKLGIVLQAGESQSPGGRSIWARMCDMSGVEMVAMDGRRNRYQVDTDGDELVSDEVDLYDGRKRMRVFAYAS